MAPQPAGRQEAMERSRSVPMRALLDRLGSGVQVLPWSNYLPAGLLPPTPVSPEHGHCGAGAGLRGLELGGRVWSLSQEAYGCRQVQAALEDAAGDEAREALAGELRGHVLQACRCPHANHVLQKCIALLRPGAVAFVVEELLLGAVAQTARHKYGCRIIQRLVEHCRPRQVQDIVEILVPDAGALSRHPYGNYVVQNLLQYGTDDQRRRMVGILAKEVRFLGSESCGSAVLGAALAHVPEADCGSLARALLQEPGLLVFMACTRHGHGAVLRALELLGGGDREEACRRLRAEAGALRVSKYGRVVVEECLEAPESSQLLRKACRGGA